jgi:hypothetical protein
MASGNAGTVPLLTAALALAAGALSLGVARAQLPDAIAALDAAPLVTLHAEGAQIYECKTGSDGKLTWTFREPIASLMLDGRTVGRHYADRHGSMSTAAACRPRSSATRRVRRQTIFPG